MCFSHNTRIRQTNSSHKYCLLKLCFLVNSSAGSEKVASPIVTAHTFVSSDLLPLKSGIQFDEHCQREDGACAHIVCEKHTGVISGWLSCIEWCYNTPAPKHRKAQKINRIYKPSLNEHICHVCSVCTLSSIF